VRIAAYYQDAAMLYGLDKFREWDVAKPVRNKSMVEVGFFGERDRIPT
jgi:hypothetical protein